MSLKSYEIMSQEELQEFYDRHKDHLVQLYFYGESEAIELHNFIQLVRTVKLVDKSELLP